MSDTVISVENLSKHYRLGVVSTGSTRRIGSHTLRDDVARRLRTSIGRNGAGKSTLVSTLRQALSTSDEAQAKQQRHVRVPGFRRGRPPGAGDLS